MSGTYDSAVSKFLSEDKEKKQTRKQELVARMHRQAPSISNFYTEFSYLRCYFILFYLSDTRLIQNTLLLPGKGTLIFRVITPSGKDGIEECSNSGSS